MRRHALALLALGLTALGGCGYALVGRGSFLPASVKIIAVPPFESRAPQPQVAEKLRTAVIEELLSRGRWKVVEKEEGSDAVLDGTITTLTVVPLSYDSSDLATREQVTITAGVSLKAPASTDLLYENRSFTFRSEYEIGEATQDTFAADSEVLDDISRSFAQSLVTSILEGF